MGGISRRDLVLGAAGLSAAAWWGTGCSPGGKQGVDAPRRGPAWSFAASESGGSWRRPSVWNDTVIAVCEVAEGAAVYAVDARGGRMRWRFPCPAKVSQPVVVDGVVVIGTGADDATGVWFGIDAVTGAERWRLQGVAGRYGAPTVADGVVYTHGVTTERASAVRAFAAADGRLRWSVPTAYQGAEVVAGAGVVYTVTGDVAGTGLDAATGRVIWSARTEVESFGHAALSTDLKTVYAMGDGGDSVVAYALATGARKWGVPVETVSGSAGFVVADDTVYVTAIEGVTALDAATGAVRWSAPTEHSPGVDPCLVAHGMVVVATGDVGEADDDGDVRKPFGDVHALDAATGARRWVFDAGTHVAESLVAGPNAVYAAHRDARLVALAPTTGNLLWQLDLPDEGFLIGTPVHAGDMLFAVGDALHGIPA